MSLDLVPAVQRILEEVKESTGKPVEFVEQENLGTYAKVKIARKSMPAHIIFYKESHGELMNHLVAHECGHIHRTFQVPDEKRLVPMSDQTNRANVISELAEDLIKLSSVLPLKDAYNMVSMWHQGIVLQLTNYPPDMMIEKWIYSSYKELRPCQRQSIMSQHADAIQALSPRIVGMTSPKIYRSSVIMNIAFFDILGPLLKTNLLKPYKNHPLLKVGRELANITKKNGKDSYEGDISMINCWAEFLGLANWFKWTSFEDLPPDYMQSI
jgi:hypothetical protein